MGVSYHKLVNTTPKPNATKNSRGELVGPLGSESCVGVGLAVADEVGVGMVALQQ